MADKSKAKRARSAASIVLFVVILLTSVLLAATGVHGVLRVLISLALGGAAAIGTYWMMTRRR